MSLEHIALLLIQTASPVRTSDAEIDRSINACTNIYTNCVYTSTKNGFSIFQDWKSVQHLFIKSGSDSLKQRVNSFDLANIDISVAIAAENLFRTYKRHEVEHISTGIAIFYDWVSFPSKQALLALRKLLCLFICVCIGPMLCMLTCHYSSRL